VRILIEKNILKDVMSYVNQGRQKKDVNEIQLKYYKNYRNMFIQLLRKIEKKKRFL